MHRTLLALTSTLLFLLGILASSVRADDMQTCRRWADDETIAACSRLIASGTQRGGDLAQATLQGRLGACHRRLHRGASARFE
jgi:hypothetical protein